MDTATRTASSSHTDARMHALLDHMPHAVAFVRAQRFERVSEHMNQLFGYGHGTELTGMTTRSTLGTDADHASLQERLSEAFSLGRPLDEEIELVRADGGHFWAHLHVAPVNWDTPDDDALWMVEDVTAARQVRAEPSWSARHDPVTELPNAREFARCLADHVGSHRRTPVSVLWLDVDGFDTAALRMGPQASQRFLFQIGRVFVSKLRASDVVARMDDDRFAMLLPECDQEHALLVAEKLREALSTTRMRWGKHSCKLKASVGAVQLYHSLHSVDAVLTAAREACESAKAAGGDRVRLYAPQGTSQTPSAA